MKHRGQGGALASGSRYEGDVTILHDLQKWPQLGRDVPLAVEEGAIHVGDDQSEIVGGGRKRGWLRHVHPLRIATWNIDD